MATTFVDSKNTIQLLNGATSTGAGSSHSVNATKRTYHVLGETSSGAGSATVTIEVSNVETPGANDWVTLATITLTLSTTTTSDGTNSVVPWRHIRANVTALSGTGATIDAWMQFTGDAFL